MKTTLDLPERLVREMKIRAATEGRKLRDVAADIIEKGLSAPARKSTGEDKRVKLPLFVGGTANRQFTPEELDEILPSQEIEFPIIKCEGPAIRQFTPDELAEVLLQQEVEWHHEASGR